MRSKVLSFSTKGNTELKKMGLDIFLLKSACFTGYKEFYFRDLANLPYVGDDKFRIFHSSLRKAHEGSQKGIPMILYLCDYISKMKFTALK